MNLNQLRYFVSLGESRSFTQAAERHYLSQTAITQQIRALEETVGLQLVDRTKRPIGLTPAGTVFLQEAKNILARVDAAVEKARDASAGMVGTLRIGYEKGYERSSLSDWLREFHRIYPNVLFTCVRADTDALAAGLLSGDLDVIFSWDSTNLRQNPEVMSMLSERSPLVVALYSDHPLARRQSLRRSQLRGETILFMTPSGSGESFGDSRFYALYEKASFTPKILLKSNDVESILIMVAAEEGISIIPYYTVAKLNNAENLSFVPLEGEEEYEEVLILWKSDRANPALNYFLDHLRKR